MKTRLLKTKGSAIATVICFVALLLLLVTSLIHTMRQHQYSVIKGLPTLQAKLMALSGVHHMLLKAKLLPTELYDAWSLAKGRNPLFNFAATTNPKVNPIYNPGPHFVTHGSAIDDYNININSLDDFTADPNGWFTGDVFAGGAWPKMQGSPVKNSQIYLWKFIADVTNKPEIQPALVIATASGDPYTGIYWISSIQETKLMSQRDYKVYQDDTISFEVTGKVIDNFNFEATETTKYIVNVKRR